MDSPSRLFAGIDLGTSGVRGVCVDNSLRVHASSSMTFDTDSDHRRDPFLWWKATCEVTQNIIDQVGPQRVVSIAVDGTSGTMLPLDNSGSPLGEALLYNDICHDPLILSTIAEHAPATAAVHGASSALARASLLLQRYPAACIAHEADWLAFQFCGKPRISDENNALKTGYDPVSRHWPDWIEATGVDRRRLPEVVPVGHTIGTIQKSASLATGLATDTQVVSGTTDGCASFLATGACKPGDGVSVLGTTLTIKLLSGHPVSAPDYGIYSHRIGEQWLAGGASNTGGGVLATFFTREEIVKLSDQIDPSVHTGLDYYPLIKAGERFPVNDSNLQPRLTPRPERDAEFLHGILEGITSIELLAYQRLQTLGAPPLNSLRTVGGGASNLTWASIRQQRLKVPFESSLSDQAAVGSARLARDGYTRALST